MRTEKIITIYPTIVKPGLGISPFMQPDPLVVVNEYPSSCSFYLTALMYFDHGKKYTTELDVTFNGESALTDTNGDENSLETFMFSPINDTSVMVGTSLYVKNIKLVGNGTYDVIYRIFEETNNGLSDMIDEKKCAIISANPIRT
ncbi:MULTISPECIES: hypothetical protein [Enterobacter cloacae complex]|uniref:hypothetical protein n=1 Tax=Enterobacter cloacae complex TaxID=354276 RepID=UPI00097C54DD|nr:hypothetical protein [Enterobacter chengduensis]HDV3818653.1 hypothetical protein [Escherichia coli]MCK7171528.1 hypothetical protein [Enterobacter chengduensis]MCM8033556.1 hypothetical protein [Enterobacter chengduensis]QEL34843.1 hypothetical protein FY206_05180 [Enterobacter chengduensis]HCD3310192.1 hypothetical protein [Enterobacter chengduensis]